jgi:hypothetical protein
MGLKGYMLWVMGHLDSTCRAPPQPQHPPRLQPPHRYVALQVEFERNFETGFFA